MSDINWDMSKDGPATFGFAITPVDSADLAQPARALYIGVSGNIKVAFTGISSPVLLMGVPAGLYPFAVTKVFSTTTTCASIVGLR